MCTSCFRGSTLKFGEKFLLALSLLALSRSFLVRVRIRKSLSLLSPTATVAKFCCASRSVPALPFSSLLRFSSGPGMKNVFIQKWNIFSWNTEVTTLMRLTGRARCLGVNVLVASSLPFSSPCSACGRTPPWCHHRQEGAAGTQTASLCPPVWCETGSTYGSSPSTGTRQTEGLPRTHRHTQIRFRLRTVRHTVSQTAEQLDRQTVGQPNRRTHCRSLQWTWGWFQTASCERAERQACRAAGSSAGSCSRWRSGAERGWLHPAHRRRHTQTVKGPGAVLLLDEESECLVLLPLLTVVKWLENLPITFSWHMYHIKISSQYH